MGQLAESIYKREGKPGWREKAVDSYSKFKSDIFIGILDEMLSELGPYQNPL